MASGFEVGQVELPRQGQLGIDAQQREDAAAGAAGDDALQAVGGRLGEIGGEIGHHQHAVRLGHLARRAVVLLDRLETRCGGRPG